MAKVFPVAADKRSMTLRDDVRFRSLSQEVEKFRGSGRGESGGRVASHVESAREERSRSKRIADTGKARSERLLELRRAVQAGEYVVRTELIADALMRSMMR